MNENGATWPDGVSINNPKNWCRKLMFSSPKEDIQMTRET